MSQQKRITTKGLITPEENYVRAHSRLTYAFGIAFHMTGNLHYLEVCRQGALALADAMDGNYGMYVRQNVKDGQWDKERALRTSQDLAYGLTGMGMYYFLTHDVTILHRIIQMKDYIFKVYMDDGRGYVTWYPKHTKDPEVQIVAQKVGELLGDPFYIEFARPKIDKILKAAYIKENGTWARRFDAEGNLDVDKEWWILAELDQACEILAIHDPSYYEYLNHTQRYWMEKMVDHENGEIWHMVNGKDDKPFIQYPKAHSWKTSLHSFEHALFGYMTASQVKNKEFQLYYAFPEWERPSHYNLAPYMFFGNIVKIDKIEKPSFMPDGNTVYKVTFNGLH